jgi:hypothetical protein
LVALVASIVNSLRFVLLLGADLCKVVAAKLNASESVEDLSKNAVTQTDMCVFSRSRNSSENSFSDTDSAFGSIDGDFTGKLLRKPKISPLEKCKLLKLVYDGY